MTRTRSSAVVLAAACAIAGCGGGGKKASTSTVERVYRAPTTGQTTPQDTTVRPPATTTTQPSRTTRAKPPPTSSSAVPGGSEPARTELTFTASKSGVKPHTASVAPFVAVKVSLVSADRSPHTLVIGGHKLKVGGTRKSAFVELPGLRAGKSYNGKADGRITIRIVSSNEPGP